MKEIAAWALETAKLRGATLAEARIVDERDRSLATKNGRIGSASDSESLGIGIRVVADGAFGFSATDDLSREGVKSCAARAVETAKASATVKSQELHMVAEPAAKAEWASPCAIDPFAVSVEKNLELLFAIDEELRKNPGVTLAETSMHFRRYEQWFFSTEGAEIHQTVITSGAGLRRTLFSGYGDPETFVSEILRRPVSEQGIRTHRRVEAAGACSGNCRAGSCLAFRRAMSGRQVRHRSGFIAAWTANSRIHRSPHRTRPRAGHGGQLRRHVVSHARQTAHASVTAARS